jgi:23S rRNA-/tRNA-specific pseudouridylate synthase
MIAHLCYSFLLFFRFLLFAFYYSTHQLNVHCAAIGHPIVGDKVYGINGEAAANGGLEEGTLSSRASADVQEAIAAAIGDKSMCVHANTISFEHPVSGEKLSFSSDAPF